ncbi:hypothetical protein DNTS_025681, partial [Danionella cerebrum]
VKNAAGPQLQKRIPDASDPLFEAVPDPTASTRPAMLKSQTKLTWRHSSTGFNKVVEKVDTAIVQVSAIAVSHSRLRRILWRRDREIIKQYRDYRDEDKAEADVEERGCGVLIGCCLANAASRHFTGHRRFCREYSGIGNAIAALKSPARSGTLSSEQEVNNLMRTWRRDEACKYTGLLKTRALGSLAPLFIRYSNLCRTQMRAAGVPRRGRPGPAALRPAGSADTELHNSAPGRCRNRDMLLHM